MDTFRTIAAEAQGIYKEKGSKFMAFAFPVKTEDEAVKKIDMLRKKYYDARHHCYAYRLGCNGELYRANDDGEPTNTAGKPILGQLLAFDISNVVVVVVRYFGGILLGTGGLIQAYKKASENALNNAEILTDIVTDTFSVSFDYSELNHVLKIIKDMNLKCFEQDFGMNCSMKITARKSLSEQLEKRLKTLKSLRVES